LRCSDDEFQGSRAAKPDAKNLATFENDGRRKGIRQPKQFVPLLIDSSTRFSKPEAANRNTRHYINLNLAETINLLYKRKSKLSSKDDYETKEPFVLSPMAGLA